MTAGLDAGANNEERKLRMKHTPEPWSVAEESFDNDGIHESVIRGLDGRAAIAVTLEFGENNPGMREANARRIVACVNALEGLNDDALFGGWSFHGIEAYAKGIEKQRAELLATMENILWHRKPGDRRSPADLLKEIEVMAKDAVTKQASNAELRGRPLADGPA